MATSPRRSYTIGDLEAMGFSRRTIRYYVQAGVLPKASGRGPTASYHDGHRRILEAILEERERRRTLPEVRESVEGPHE